MKKIITMKTRFLYLHDVFINESNLNFPFPQFMECLFSKLETEIRMGTSGIDKYFKEGEGETVPISNKPDEFQYDYEK